MARVSSSITLCLGNPCDMSCDILASGKLGVEGVGGLLLELEVPEVPG